MKKLLLLLAVVLFTTLNVQAQFDVTSGTDTEQTITIDSNTYDIMETKNHSPYIICNSPRTGNDYAVWIGEETDKTYEGQPVRITKSGKYFVLIISKNSKNPYPKYIKLEENS